MSNRRTSIHDLKSCRWVLHLASVWLVACGCRYAEAQTAFTWDTVDPAYAEPRQVSAQQGVKTNIVMGRVGLAANQGAFEDWYRKYLFPAMASEDHLGDVYDLRDSLSKDLERASDPTVHQLLVDIAFDEATKRIAANYNPRVRFNAMLIVGQLNQAEQRLVGPDRYPPVRLAKAFDVLLAELQKPDQLDVLRVAAMIGLERHFFLVDQRPQDQPIPDARRAETVSLMTALVGEKAPPEGRSADAHAWLRRKAMDVLGAVGQVGDGQSVFNALRTIVSDSEEPLSVRLTAARTLGELNYAGVTGIDAVAVAQELGALAAHTCRLEDTWVKDKQKELERKTRKPGAGMGVAGMGGFPGADMAGFAGGAAGFPGGEAGFAGGAAGFPGGEAGFPGAGMGLPGGDVAGVPGGPMSGLGFRGVRRNEEMDHLVSSARRRLKYPVFCAQHGIRGPERKAVSAAAAAAATAAATPAGRVRGSLAQIATDDAQKATINKVLGALDGLIQATDLVDDSLEEMMTQVREKTRELEAMLPQPAEPETETPEADLPGAGGTPAAPPAKKEN